MLSCLNKLLQFLIYIHLVRRLRTPSFRKSALYIHLVRLKSFTLCFSPSSTKVFRFTSHTCSHPNATSHACHQSVAALSRPQVVSWQFVEVCFRGAPPGGAAASSMWSGWRCPSRGSPRRRLAPSGGTRGPPPRPDGRNWREEREEERTTSASADIHLVDCYQPISN